MRPTPVVEKHYQLVVWMLPKIGKFPKEQRFLLADRMARALLEILEMLIAAVVTGNRRELLAQANVKLDTLRYLLRLARDLRYISLSGYDYAAARLLEIGRMVGGWRRAEQGRVPPPG